MKKIKKKEKGKGKGKVKELPLKKFKCGAKFQGIVDVQAVVATNHQTDCRDEVSYLVIYNFVVNAEHEQSRCKAGGSLE